MIVRSVKGREVALRRLRCLTGVMGEISGSGRKWW